MIPFLTSVYIAKSLKISMKRPKLAKHLTESANFKDGTFNKIVRV